MTGQDATGRVQLPAPVFLLCTIQPGGDMPQHRTSTKRMRFDSFGGWHLRDPRKLDGPDDLDRVAASAAAFVARNGFRAVFVVEVRDASVDDAPAWVGWTEREFDACAVVADRGTTISVTRRLEIRGTFD